MMDIVLWVVAAAMALAFGIGGASQIVLPKERYRGARSQPALGG